MQIYKEIPIITNQPTEEERKGLPHLLFGHRSITEHSDLTKWLHEVADTINEQTRLGKKIILVGGTGMYLKCLIEGVTTIPEIPREVREGIVAQILADGLPVVYDNLIKLDEQSQKLKPADTQRIIRAYEVVLHTGRSIFDWQKQPNKKFFEISDFVIHYLNISRQKTYEKINYRFLKMLEWGVAEEAGNAGNIFDKAVLSGKKLSDLPAHKAHGLRELIAYTKGEMSLEAAIQKAQQVTRNYAKRQLTWWRGWSLGLEKQLEIVEYEVLS